LQPGQNIDGYRVVRVLHSGTRSHLYLVEADQKRYALKAPSENFAEDPQYLEGFIREQWVGRRIDHAGVMKIYPRPEGSPFLYLLCEYVEGQTLRQWMFDHPRPDLAEARRLLGDIVAALRAFQRLHMTHRDLKPENIMLTGDGRVKIIDFGTVQVGGLEELSGAAREEVPVGSVHYSAPEYLHGGRGAHVSDIFSIGVIAYELLTGKLPYDLPEHRQQDRNARASRDIWRYISARVPRPELPEWFDLALRKATHPYPQQRYEALSEFLQDLHVPNKELVDKHRSAPLLERNPLLFWRALALILAVVVVVQWALLSS
jgi:serine/threonine protein kinase